MTGAYLRVRRDGKMANVEVEHLTDEERRTLFRMEPEELLRWLNFMCERMKHIEEKYFEKEDDNES